MAKMYKTIRMKYSPDAAQTDDPAVFILRSPTDTELNDFTVKRYSIREDDRLAIFKCRAEFFDSLLTGIENFKDAEDRDITLEGKDQIPTQAKSNAIYQKFEYQTIDIKN